MMGIDPIYIYICRNVLRRWIARGMLIISSVHSVERTLGRMDSTRKTKIITKQHSSLPIAGKAYCKNDFFAQFAPRCKGCNRSIMSNFITALGTHWHPECFVCQVIVHADCLYSSRIVSRVCLL